MKYFILYLTAIILTIVSASMTVIGIMSLFASQSIFLIGLFVSLELAKASIFGIVLVIANLKHKIPLFIFATLLITISFVGHFSFLTQQYKLNKSEAQGSELTVSHIQDTYNQEKKSLEDQISFLKDELVNNNKELETIQKNINSYDKPNSRNWVTKQNQPRINELSKRNENINNKIQELYTQLNNSYDKYSNKINEINNANKNIASRSIFKNTADIIGISEEFLANIINVILALVIDSLALTMLWVAGDVYKKKKDNDGYDCRNYSYNGISVDDILKMNEKDIDMLKSKMITENQKKWFNSVMKLRSNM